MLTKDIAEQTVEKLRADLETSLKELSAMLMNAVMTSEIAFHEYDISAPIHSQGDNDNLTSTIYGVEIASSGHLVFHVDNSYSNYEVLIEEVSLENLILILGEIESLTDHLK